MKNESGIYTIKNIITGKIYIGSAVNIEKRYGEHKWALKNNCHNNQHLQRAYNKDGLDNFIFNEYLICKKEELIFHEQITIDSYILRIGWKNLYNINPTAGSTLGRKCSEETRKKISESEKGKTTWNKGIPRTEEEKQKIRETKAKNPHICSDVTRRKMSKKRKGIKFSEEHKKNLSKSIFQSWKIRKGELCS